MILDNNLPTVLFSVCSMFTSWRLSLRLRVSAPFGDIRPCFSVKVIITFFLHSFPHPAINNQSNKQPLLTVVVPGTCLPALQGNHFLAHKQNSNCTHAHTLYHGQFS